MEDNFANTIEILKTGLERLCAGGVRGVAGGLERENPVKMDFTGLGCHGVVILGW